MLRAILLGLLETPASGYDLRLAFEETVQHFWRAELSQIYPTLHQLKREKRVRVSTEPSTRGPVRKVYARTPSGTEELRRWVMEGPTLDGEKFGWLGQLFFMRQVADVAATRTFLESLRTAYASRLRALEAIDAHHRRGRRRPPDLEAGSVHEYLTLLCGLRRIGATVAWCDEALALIDELEAEESSRKRRSR